MTRPYPGAFGFLKDEKVLFWWAAVREGPELEPGEIAVRGETVLIGTACGVLVPSEIEVEGKVYTNNEIAEYFEPHKGECMT